MSEEGKRKPGRPPGTEESPESLLRKELIAQIKLYRRLREMVQRQVDAEGVRMDAEELGHYMDLLRKGITDLGRSILPPAKPAASPQEEESGEDLLRQMLEGEGRK